MQFPATLELIKHYNVFLVSGPLVLTLSLYCWVRFFRSLSGKPQKAPLSNKPSSPANLLAFALVTLLIGGVHFWGAYASVANALRFHQIDPARMTQMRIQKMKGESAPGEAPLVTLDNPDLIQKGWSTLAGARSRMRNHEHFEDGYRIQLCFGEPPQPSNYYLSVFWKSSRDPNATIVIPHIGTESSGTVSNGGEYSCPEFLQWVHDHVDPLFQKPS